jgi:hypothetical protein
VALGRLGLEAVPIGQPQVRDHQVRAIALDGRDAAPLLQHDSSADGDPGDEQGHTQQRDRYDVIGEEAKRRGIELGDNAKPRVNGQGDRRPQEHQLDQKESRLRRGRGEPARHVGRP